MLGSGDDNGDNEDNDTDCFFHPLSARKSTRNCNQGRVRWPRLTMRGRLCSTAARVQGSIVQAVQHYKGCEGLSTKGSAQSISDQHSLGRPRQGAPIADDRCLCFVAPMHGNQLYSDWCVSLRHLVSGSHGVYCPSPTCRLHLRCSCTSGRDLPTALRGVTTTCH